MPEKQAFKRVNKRYLENAFSICEYLNHLSNILVIYMIRYYGLVVFGCEQVGLSYV